MNILLIGLGRWGEQHLRVLGELGVTVWAADVSAARREWAVRHGLDPRLALGDRSVLAALLNGMGREGCSRPT